MIGKRTFNRDRNKTVNPISECSRLTQEKVYKKRQRNKDDPYK